MFLKNPTRISFRALDIHAASGSERDRNIPNCSERQTDMQIGITGSEKNTNEKQNETDKFRD